MKIKNKIKRIIAFLLILLLVVNNAATVGFAGEIGGDDSDTSAGTTGSGRDLGDIFTDVGLKIVTDEGDEELVDGAMIEITENTEIRVTWKWEIDDDEDGTVLKSGDFAETPIPTILKGIEGQLEGPLKNGDQIIGSYTIVNNTLRVEFNDELVNLDGRHGTAWVSLNFDLSKFEEDIVQIIEFETPIDKELTVIAKPNGPTFAIAKSGKPNAEINAEYINWVIDVNTELKSIDHAIIEDEVPEGLGDPYDIEIYELTIGLKDNTEKSSEKTAEKFPVDLGAIDSAYRIKYKTKVTSYAKSEYTNKATLKNGEEFIDDAEFTINKLAMGSSIEKTGVANNGGTNSTKITWTIDINKSERELDDVRLEDAITGTDYADLILDAENISIYKLNKNGDRWTQGDDVTGDFEFTGFPIDLGDLGKEDVYRIVYAQNAN